jgi:hypothetical protein
MAPTIQQQAVMDLFESQFGPVNTERQTIFIEAVAGSGKTSLLMMLVDVILKIKREQPGRDIKGVAVSFNTHIKKELESRLDRKGANGYMQSKTTNGLGFAILNAVAGNGGLPKTKVEPKKYTAICKSELEMRGHFRPQWKIINAAVKLCDFCRLTMVEPTEANMIAIVLHYDLSKEIDILDPNWNDIWQSARDAIDTGIREYKRTGIIDFTDQIYLPLKLNLASPIYDVIFVDEAQDLNQVRLQLILSSIKKNGQLVFVGDIYQAIQGFAGADTDSVNTIIKATNAKVMPLSVCFRSDANIISMAQQIVPHIESRDEAPEGNVEVIKEGDFLSMLHEGEMDRMGNVTKDPSFVMCRTKAPLASKCMSCLRAGKTAVIRGKSIGEMLMGLIEKFAKVKGIRDFERASLDDLKEGAEIYQSRQAKKIGLSDDADEKLNELYDTMDTFFVLVEAYIDQEQDDFSVPRLQTFIESKFSDGDKTAITFSTVHKAKGLEYDDVFIIEPHLMPLKYAKLDWQIQQEWNILYVALTRAKHNLYFVGSAPGSLLMPGEEIEEDAEQLELAVEAEEIEESPIKIVEAIESTQEEIEPIAIEERRGKAGRPKGTTKAAKGEKKAREVKTYLQLSMMPEAKDQLMIMLENYNNDNEDSLSMSELLLQIIKESPMFQQAEEEYQEANTVDRQLSIC